MERTQRADPPHPRYTRYARPMEEVAKAIHEDRNGAGAEPWSRKQEVYKRAYRSDAKAALVVLRKLGFISDLGISAIEAERANNG